LIAICREREVIGETETNRDYGWRKNN